jgi:predicted aldo/keto reductase-like oxidoreductase
MNKIDEVLENVRGLEDGWYDGEGIAPNKKILDNAEKIVKSILCANLEEEPFASPSPDGVVVLELRSRKEGLAISIDVDEYSAHLFASKWLDDVKANRCFSIDCGHCISTLVSDIKKLLDK